MGGPIDRAIITRHNINFLAYQVARFFMQRKKSLFGIGNIIITGVAYKTLFGIIWITKYKPVQKCILFSLGLQLDLCRYKIQKNKIRLFNVINIQNGCFAVNAASKENRNLSKAEVHWTVHSLYCSRTKKVLFSVQWPQQDLVWGRHESILYR